MLLLGEYVCVIIRRICLLLLGEHVRYYWKNMCVIIGGICVLLIGEYVSEIIFVIVL